MAGTGLKGEYFEDFGDQGPVGRPKLTRIDPTVDFNWHWQPPAPDIKYDRFSVRWSGQVDVPKEGPYTFHTATDDGVRLWVDGKLLIDEWRRENLDENFWDKVPPKDGEIQGVHRKSINLTAGRHDIKMEYFQDTELAVARLCWSSDFTPMQIVPASQLYHTGLKGEYFDNKDLSGSPKLTRIDLTVDFDWKEGSPDPSIPEDDFSVRWSGQVQAQHDETYTFHTVTDDGVRLWVDGKSLINKWELQSIHYPDFDKGAPPPPTGTYPGVNRGDIQLAAGKTYDIKMEYYEHQTNAVAKLYWSSKSTPIQIVPTSQLYPYVPTSGGIDAAVLWNNVNAYFFKGRDYVRCDVASRKTDSGYPKRIAYYWSGLPESFTSGIDAAVLLNKDNKDKAYFFKGPDYVRYDVASDKTDSGYPKRIAGNWSGLPESFTSDLDAAVLWNNGKAYFFKGPDYVRYDVASDKTDSGYPKRIADYWPGLPESFTSDLDAAVLWNNGKAYFFKGPDYVSYDVASGKTDSGYPKRIDDDWPGLLGGASGSPGG